MLPIVNWNRDYRPIAAQQAAPITSLLYYILIHKSNMSEHHIQLLYIVAKTEDSEFPTTDRHAVYAT